MAEKSYIRPGESLVEAIARNGVDALYEARNFGHVRDTAGAHTAKEGVRVVLEWLRSDWAEGAVANGDDAFIPPAHALANKIEEEMR